MAEADAGGGDRRLNELLNTLPACRRCRANKRGCDTLLPSCRNCSKAAVECIFFDHVLGEDLPRSYISSLLNLLSGTISENGSSTAQSHPRISNGPEATQPQGIASNEPIPARSRQIFGSRYLGSSSCLSQSLTIRSPENGALLNPVRPSFPFEDLEADLQITPKIHQHLIQQYVLEINPLYPILDSSLSFLSLESPSVNDMTPSETFILQIMYSISCHWDDGLSTKLLGLSDACYTRALKHIDTVTANLTHLTLQAISLLALRGLFDPQKGNFGQLIAFASRLVIDIGGQDITAHGQEIRNIYTSIYCMENQFATALDRPQFLPEPTRPMDFDVSRPSEYLCSLYRIQAKYRNGSRIEARELMQRVPLELLKTQTYSVLLTTACETQLLLDPSPQVAACLLKAYTAPRSVQTFLTPHWTYRAGSILLEQKYADVESPETVEAYASCLVVLDRSSARWPGATALKESLQSYMKTKLSRNRSTITSNSTG